MLAQLLTTLTFVSLPGVFAVVKVVRRQEGVQTTMPANGSISGQTVVEVGGEDCGQAVTEFGDLEWALQIDGALADARGCHALGPEFEKAFEALRYTLKELGSAEIGLEMIQKINDLSGHKGFRTFEVPLGDHAPACFAGMSCDKKKEILQGLPTQLCAVQATSECSVQIIMPKKAEDLQGGVEGQLKSIINDYNNAMRHAVSSHSIKISILALFLRSFAWLHPFGDHNGRARTILLQHEIRRHGLGRGAVMYNNNRDVYFISASTYAAKIEEGIHMADRMFAEKKNPWLDANNVKKYKEKFPHPGPACHEGGDGDPWGSVWLISRPT
jgi:hypothetical protein